MGLKDPPPALFLLEARINSGTTKGAHQLRKDLRAMVAARAEIMHLQNRVSTLEDLLTKEKAKSDQQAPASAGGD